MKLSITAADLKRPAAQERTSILMHIDTTGMSFRDQAEALFALALRVDALGKVEERATTLRERIEARGFKVATRLDAPPHPDVLVVTDAAGRVLGNANLISSPLKQAQKRARKRRAQKRTMPAQRYLEAEEARFVEDDEVEYLEHGDWRPGIVIDGGMGVWVVEDQHGRHVEVYGDDNIKRKGE